MKPIREVHLECFDPILHSEILRKWLLRPHVAQWWGDPQRALEIALKQPPESRAVIVADGVTVGYVSWQPLPDSEIEAAGLAGLPEDIVDIDILIGELDYVGRGVGPKALELLLNRLKADGAVSAAGMGTSVSNEHAIKAFEKAGFSLFREFEDPEFGLCRYMVRMVGDAV